MENIFKEIEDYKNKINDINNKLDWYKRTYENRRLAGIIKDRIKNNKQGSTKQYSFINKFFVSSIDSKISKKIIKSKIYSNNSKKLLCTIVNYNLNENALKLRASFSKYFDTIVFDSGSRIKYNKFVQLDNVYYSGLFNHSYQCAKYNNYKYILFICSDVEIADDQIEKIYKRISSINIDEIGVYSPSSTGRSHFYCKKQYDKGLRVVPFVEGFIFLANIDILAGICPINLNINKYGWGLDVALGFFAKKWNKLCVVDDEISVYHPEGTGYSEEFADEEMWKWVKMYNNNDFTNFCTKQINIIRRGLAGENKISVIIPCYNQAEYIKETIYSILFQEYSNFEIIIVNDGSTDYTEMVVNELCDMFSQIKYIFKSNGGLGSARNVGLKNITGDFVQFLDSDDLISKNKFLNQIYDFIKDPFIHISYSEYLSFEDGDKNKTWTYSRLRLKEDPILDLIQNWETELSIPVHCFLFKTSVIGNEKFDEELPNHEDWEFHLRIASHKPIYKYQSNAIALYRVRSTSMARDNELMNKGKKMCLKKAIDSNRFFGKYLEELKIRYNEN